MLTTVVLQMGPAAYRSAAHHVNSQLDTIPIMASSQRGLSIQDGPMFSVDIFQFPDQDKEITVYMVAHHLCVDLVSWRIIVRDLSQIIETGSLQPDVGLTFRSWISLQARHDKSISDPSKLLPFPEPAAPDLGYWGLSSPEAVENLTYGRTETEAFCIDEEITKLALGDCHKTFRSEPMDLYLAAIAQSFANTFRDRNVPVLHIESHGREVPSGLDIDLSQTVGWFTTICPLALSARAGSSDVVDVVRRAKDRRRLIPDNGRPYFAHKWLAKKIPSSAPMEILFNYLGGGVQKLDSSEADASRSGETDENQDKADDSWKETADVGPTTKRLAIFEISAVVTENKLQFSFIFDPSVGPADQVRSWIANCKTTIEQMVQGLTQRSVEPTLSDYPLLGPNLTYNDLKRLTEISLPRVGIDPLECFDRVEDIYPCSPVQEGMLITQLRDPNAYLFHAVYHVKMRNQNHKLDVAKLTRAWQKVVDRHSALRTVFIESVRRGGVFDQIVFSQIDSGAVVLEADNEAEALSKLDKVMMRDPEKPQQFYLPHKMAVCTTRESGLVLMKLEINHSATDGGSLAIMLEELSSAYKGELDNAPPGPLYSNYIKYIHSLPADEDTKYWTGYLKGLQPCYFPRLNGNGNSETRTLRATTLKFDQFPALRQLSETSRVTIANIMHAAWAFVLRKYTGSSDVCFGYLAADREAPVENIQRTIGTLINMLCCRVQIDGSPAGGVRLEDVFKTAQDEHLESLTYQRCSLALVQHALGLSGKPLYNTTISTQNHSESDEKVGVEGVGEDSEEEDIVFDMEQGHDPSEYVITVNIETSTVDSGVVLRYWTDHVTEEQAEEVADSMTQVLNAFINHPSQLVASFDRDPDGADTTLGEGEPIDSAMLDSQHTKVSSGEVSSRKSQDLSSWSIVDSESFPDASGEESSTEAGSSQDLVRTVLMDIWKELLHMPDDDIMGHDSFFDLGGDSVTAMKLVGEARDQGLTLTVADVFRYPCLDDLAAAVNYHIQNPGMVALGGADIVASHPFGNINQDGEDLYEKFSLLAAHTSNVDSFLQTSIVPQVGVFRGGLSDVLPATDFQALAVTGAMLQSHWMLNFFFLDGDGPLDLPQLKRACFRLVQNLDILRTVFIPSNGRFLQVVLRNMRPIFHTTEVDDLDALQQPPASFEDSVRLDEPFVEFTVVRQKHSSRHRIYLRLSHAQYDGVCFPKILDALQTVYRGQPIAPPPSFANYLRAAAGTLTSAHYRHWKALLAGSSMTEIIHHPNGPSYSSRKGTNPTYFKQTVRLPPVESGHITTATVIKAAWAYTLAQISASDDVVFGHTISGRNAAVDGVENMIGPCLNLLPVRVRFDSSKEGTRLTRRGLLHQVQDQQLSNMPHEVLGFREIIRHCTTWPSWTYFSSTVQHQNVDDLNPGSRVYSGTPVRLGDTSYRIGSANSASPGIQHEEFADLSILSQRYYPKHGENVQGDHVYEIMISFVEGGDPNTTVPREFVQRALDMLCEAAEQFATETESGLDAPLPSGAELGSLPRQLPLCADIGEHSTRSSGHGDQLLSRLTREHFATLSKQVRMAWRQVLTGSCALPGACEAEIQQRYNEIDGMLDLDTSFFAMGGDIIGLAQVAWLLSGGGQDNATGLSAVPHVRLEDLIDVPTIRGHMGVLLAAVGPETMGSSPIDPNISKAALRPSNTFNALEPVGNGNEADLSGGGVLGDAAAPNVINKKIQPGNRVSTLPAQLKKLNKVDSSLGAAKKTMVKLFGKKFTKD